MNVAFDIIGLSVTVMTLLAFKEKMPFTLSCTVIRKQKWNTFYDCIINKSNFVR